MKVRSFGRKQSKTETIQKMKTAAKKLLAEAKADREKANGGKPISR